MSSTPTASPTVHVNNWSDTQVSDWLNNIGLSKYAKDFRGNGITGDVLVLLDDDALRDIGVATVGQRLSLLASIYRLKLQFGIPVQEGDWVPKSVETHDDFHGAVASSPHLVSLLRQRDDRIRMLEGHVYKLADYLSHFQQDFASVCRHVGVKAPSSETPISIYSRSADARGHSHTSSDSSMHSLSAFGAQSEATSASSHALESPTSRNFPGIVSPSRLGFSMGSGRALNSGLPVTASSHGYSPYSQHAKHGELCSSSLDDGTSHSGASHTTVSAGPTSGFKAATVISNRGEGYSNSNSGATPNTPTTGNASALSTAAPTITASEMSPTQTTPSATPTFTAPTGGIHAPHVTGPNNSAMASPTRRTPGTSSGAATNTKQSGSTKSSTNDIASGSAVTASSSAGMPKTTQASTPTSAKTSGSGSTDSNPYKSFRVTLDDPCYRVLPAALKKYKIVDDWRLYALFICYGNTERCLSYDEKPLLLFQKLKENNQSPVFMLRHIRDVKSPIAIANAKAAVKKDSGHTKKGGAARTDGRHVVPGSPPAGVTITHLESPKETGPAVELPSHAKANKTYAVSIYPYVSERNDEFDVGVGDTFVVLNKAKGWWVVQRDGKGDGTGDVVYSQERDESDYQAEVASGWVPAGCLLETSKPLGSIVSGPSTPMAAVTQVAKASIPPSLITSTSTPGIMLMDYKSSEDNLDLKKEDRLRVFKRYNHWSYCVQEGDGHARGWVPSWYIGKLSSGSSSSASRDTPATKGSVGTKLSPTNLVDTAVREAAAAEGEEATKDE